ncbi:unnamed protein product [Ostreobium quekettii]|uniref:Sugar phosphate transporter domain-containing protein n=1 Tax=Ostreobium quekettii TaxID=121088 RepID=A0A8S1JAC6_9CHLO|nr:unnamed protein product [Ostreobium quekettii]|eukprot:evm.model.scf_2795.3 EVM.evm.TU.scf_2795.3   scf_2795:13089-14666(-)
MVEILRPAAYGLLNIVTASGIVFANKTVFQVYGFHFTIALTWIHTLFTIVGMRIFLRAGMFEHRDLPKMRLLPLAAAFVAYIVLCNLNLNINTVGFYQISKIAVAPAVLGLEAVLFGKRASLQVVLSVVVVCAGIGLATVTDSQVATNAMGLLVGLGAVTSTAMYQIFAGTKQKELQASSMQLLNEFAPQAALLLGVLVPILEPVGWREAGEGTLLGYRYSAGAVCAIFISAALGLLVSLSTFLVIGATSSLTYNVVGHMKTIIILTGGVLFFGDEMPPKKLLGVGVSLVGMVWYSQLKLRAAMQQSSK